MTSDLQPDRLRGIVQRKWASWAPVGSPAEEQVLAADQLALAGEHEAALAGYRTALTLDPACEPAGLGEVVALLATGATAAALSIMEARFARSPADPVTRFHLGLALYATSLDVRAHVRGGTPMIVTRGQARTCQALAERILGLGVDDPPLNQAATELRAEAEAVQGWEWVPGTRLTPVAIGLALSLALHAVGVAESAITPMVLGALLGAITLFLHVVLNRKQRLDLRARRYGRLLTRDGA